MPFTPPAQYSSTGTTGYESTFGVDPAGGSPPDIIPFVELKSFTINFGDRPEVNFTHLLSPNYTEEISPGPTKPGTIDFSGNFTGDISQMDLDGLQINRTPVPFKAVSPTDQAQKTCTVTGFGYLASQKFGDFEIGKPIEYSEIGRAHV